MKIIVFGTGLYYENRKRQIDTVFPTGEICAFLDNNVDKHVQDGIQVYRPSEIVNLDYDIVLIMSSYYDEMYHELDLLNVPVSKIVKWENALKKSEGSFVKYFCGKEVVDSKGRVLVVSVFAGYSGVPIVATYMAKALMSIGYDAWVCAEGYDQRFVNEQVQIGINIIIYPNLHHGGIEERNWLRQFDYVIVNSFTMAKSVSWMSRQTHLVWWIHEASDYVKKVLTEEKEEIEQLNWNKIKLLAVSDVARNNISSLVDVNSVEIFPYGIPNDGKNNKNKQNKFVFAIIGTIEPRKAVDIFIDAAQRIDSRVCEFRIIGAIRDEEYAKKQLEKIKGESSIIYKGELSQRAVNDMLSEIDVLICPSREDPFPVTVVEAMMHSIPVIVSNKIGEASYITNGKNGYVFKDGDINELIKYMELLLTDNTLLDKVGQNARALYNDYFTMEQFAQRIETLIEQMK